MNQIEVYKKIKQFPYWYHKINLGCGITTPGWAPINPIVYMVPECLDGKRVLDVGAWDGYWTFEALKCGAREVIAIDDFSDTIGINGVTRKTAWDTFDLCKDVLGYKDDVCKRFDMSLYNLSEKTFGKFDVVFFLRCFISLPSSTFSIRYFIICLY